MKIGGRGGSGRGERLGETFWEEGRGGKGFGEGMEAFSCLTRSWRDEK